MYIPNLSNLKCTNVEWRWEKTVRSLRGDNANLMEHLFHSSQIPGSRKTFASSWQHDLTRGQWTTICSKLYEKTCTSELFLVSTDFVVWIDILLSVPRRTGRYSICSRSLKFTLQSLRLSVISSHWVGCMKNIFIFLQMYVHSCEGIKSFNAKPYTCITILHFQMCSNSIYFHCL